MIGDNPVASNANQLASFSSETKQEVQSQAKELWLWFTSPKKSLKKETRITQAFSNMGRRICFQQKNSCFSLATKWGSETQNSRVLLKTSRYKRQPWHLQFIKCRQRLKLQYSRFAEQFPGISLLRLMGGRPWLIHPEPFFYNLQLLLVQRRCFPKYANEIRHLNFTCRTSTVFIWFVLGVS